MKEEKSSLIRYSLTTYDNPYDPFEQFVPWFMFDIQKGYNSCGLLARTLDALGLSTNDDELSDEEIEKNIETAINEILNTDFMGIYVKVSDKNKKNELVSSDVNS